jgi:hypothetical protein
VSPFHSYLGSGAVVLPSPWLNGVARRVDVGGLATIVGVAWFDWNDRLCELDSYINTMLPRRVYGLIHPRLVVCILFT